MASTVDTAISFVKAEDILYSWFDDEEVCNVSFEESLDLFQHRACSGAIVKTYVPPIKRIELDTVYVVRTLKLNESEDE